MNMSKVVTNELLLAYTEHWTDRGYSLCRKFKGTRNPWISCTSVNTQHFTKAVAALSVDYSTDGDKFKIAYFNPERKQRLKLRTGKFVRKMLLQSFPFLRFTNQEIQTVGSRINAQLWCKGKIELLHGEAIRQFYQNSGVSSCMSREHAQDFLDIYVDNPQAIELATIQTEENNVARALVWNTGGKKYMDVIYYTSSAAYQALKDYREQEGWGSPIDMKREEITVKCKIRNGCGSFWPYFDTMCNVTLKDNECVLDSVGFCDYCGQRTDGTLDGLGLRCVICDKLVPEGDSYLVNNETYCSECYDHNCSTCEYCEEVFMNEHLIEIEETFLCDVCCGGNAFYCEVCENQFLDINGNETGDGTVCNDCYEEYVECQDCGEVVSNSYYDEETKGDYCKLCYEALIEVRKLTSQK